MTELVYFTLILDFSSFLISFYILQVLCGKSYYFTYIRVYICKSGYFGLKFFKKIFFNTNLLTILGKIKNKIVNLFTKNLSVITIFKAIELINIYFTALSQSIARVTLLKSLCFDFIEVNNSGTFFSSF